MERIFNKRVLGIALALLLVFGSCNTSLFARAESGGGGGSGETVSDNDAETYYTVTYWLPALPSTNTKMGYEVRQVKKGDPVPDIAAPEKEGYTFDHWDYYGYGSDTYNGVNANTNVTAVYYGPTYDYGWLFYKNVQLHPAWIEQGISLGQPSEEDETKLRKYANLVDIAKGMGVEYSSTTNSRTGDIVSYLFEINGADAGVVSVYICEWPTNKEIWGVDQDEDGYMDNVYGLVSYLDSSGQVKRMPAFVRIRTDGLVSFQFEGDSPIKLQLISFSGDGVDLSGMNIFRATEDLDGTVSESSSEEIVEENEEEQPNVEVSGREDVATSEVSGQVNLGGGLGSQGISISALDDENKASAVDLVNYVRANLIHFVKYCGVTFDESKNTSIGVLDQTYAFEVNNPKGGTVTVGIPNDKASSLAATNGVDSSGYINGVYAIVSHRKADGEWEVMPSLARVTRDGLFSFSFDSYSPIAVQLISIKGEGASVSGTVVTNAAVKSPGTGDSGNSYAGVIIAGLAAFASGVVGLRKKIRQ